MSSSIANLEADLIDFLLDKAGQEYEKSCFIVPSREVFLDFSEHNNSHCIVVPVFDIPIEALQSQFGMGGVAELSSDGDAVNLKIHHGNVRLPSWFVESAKYNPPFFHIILASKGYIAIFDIVNAELPVPRQHVDSLNARRCTDDFPERTHISESIVITIDDIIRVDLVLEVPEADEVIPF